MVAPERLDLCMGRALAAWSEDGVDLVMSGNGILHLLARLEPSHDVLSSSYRHLASFALRKAHIHTANACDPRSDRGKIGARSFRKTFREFSSRYDTTECWQGFKAPGCLTGQSRNPLAQLTAHCAKPGNVANHVGARRKIVQPRDRAGNDRLSELQPTTMIAQICAKQAQIC